MQESQIAFYARVSSEKQAQEKTIESQLASLKEYAKLHQYGMREDLQFIDEGVTGTTLARAGLDALRDEATRGTIDKVLVLTPDRLARKHAHQLILIEEFKRLGVEIIFTNRKIASTPEDQLLLQIQGVISEYEREQIIERSRRGKLYKAKQGKVSVLSAAPYGYRYIPKNNQDARYEINDEEAQVVRRIFHMLVYQQMSIRAIAKQLTLEEIPTGKRVGYWHRSVVWEILKNSAYIGKAAYRKTEAVESKKRAKRIYPKNAKSSCRQRPEAERIYIDVPAIINQEIFDRAAEQLKRNKKLSARNKKNHYLLSGFLRCKECGHCLYGKPDSRSHQRRYYRCTGQDNSRWPGGRICSSRPVRVEVVDDLVWQQVTSLLQQPELVFQEYATRLNSKQQSKHSFEKLIVDKNKKIRRQKNEKERLLDLYQRGSIDIEEIEERLLSINLKIKNLQDQIVLIQREAEHELRQLQLIENFDSFREKLVEDLSLLQFDKKREIIKLLVEEVVVNTKDEEILVQHVIPTDGKLLLCPGGRHSHAERGNEVSGYRSPL